MNPEFLKKLAEITAALRSGITLGGDPLGELQKRATQAGEDFGLQMEKNAAQAGYAKSHPKSLRAQREMMVNSAMLALQLGAGGERPTLKPAIKIGGRIVEGTTHADAYGVAGISEPLAPKFEGFIDQHNKWYTRQAAEKLMDNWLSKSVKAQMAERSRQAGRKMGMTTEDVNGKLYANKGTKADEPIGADEFERIVAESKARKAKAGASLDSAVVHPLMDAMKKEGQWFQRGDNEGTLFFRGEQYPGDDWHDAASRVPHQVPPSAEQLHKLLTENKGFTVDPRTGEPVSGGYAVGGGNKEGVLLQKPLAELNPKQLQFWLKQNMHKIAPDQSLGGWVDDKGVAYIEPSTQVADLNEAQRLGNERGEKAIWDHANKTEIPLKAQKAEDAAAHVSEFNQVLSKWDAAMQDYRRVGQEIDEFPAQRRKSLADALRNPDRLPVAPAYHATRYNFDQFDPINHGELGSHFGTREQANDIIAHVPRMDGVSSPRTFQAQLHLKNPLRLKDEGGFSAPMITDQLVSKGILTTEEAQRIDELSIDGEPVNKMLHDALAKKGYDGVVYLNRREGLGFGEQKSNYDKHRFVSEMNKTNHLSDEDFKTQFPRATDSHIAFKPEQIAVKKTFTPGTPYLTKFSQRDVLRPEGNASKIDAIEELAYKAFKGPQFLKWLKAGKGTGSWYDTRATQSQAIDALGDKLGPDAFNDLIDHMAASTAMSRPENNLRRASWWRALKLNQLLDPAELRKSTLAAPEGFGHIAQRAHHFATADLVELGQVNPLVNPKPASFAENLKMNWRPYTNDTRMATATLQAQPKLSLGLVGKPGDATPRKWAYAPMERAAQRAAAELHGRGLIDSPPDGVDPTAAWQAQVWGGIGKEGNRGMGLKPSQFAGNFHQIVDAMIARSAKMWGVSPAKANELFWKGQPLDLPLNASLLKGPSRPRKK